MQHFWSSKKCRSVVCHTEYGIVKINIPKLAWTKWLNALLTDFTTVWKAQLSQTQPVQVICHSWGVLQWPGQSWIIIQCISFTLHILVSSPMRSASLVSHMHAHWHTPRCKVKVGNLDQEIHWTGKISQNLQQSLFWLVAYPIYLPMMQRVHAFSKVMAAAAKTCRWKVILCFCLQFSYKLRFSVSDVVQNVHVVNQSECYGI